MSGSLALTRFSPVFVPRPYKERSKRFWSSFLSMNSRCATLSRWLVKPTRSSVSLSTSRRLVMGQRRVISAFRCERLIGSGCASTFESWIRVLLPRSTIRTV